MSNPQLKIFLMDYDNLQKFFRQFALIKIIATDTTVVENQDSFLIRNFDRTPTSLGMKDHLFGSAGFNNKIKAETRILNERFGQYILRTAKKDPTKMVDNSWTWIDKHVQHCRKFYTTYSKFAGELNDINMKMQRALGFGICAGSIAQASAELVLILSGVGLPVGRLVRTVPITIKEIGLRAALGFEIGYSIGVVEEWGKANNADVMALNVKDGDKVGGTGTFVGFGGDYLKEIALETNTARTLEITNSVKRNGLPSLSRADKVKLAQKQNTATAAPKAQGQKIKTGIKGLTALNYLLAVKGTYDALEKCVNHCSFKV